MEKMFTLTFNTKAFYQKEVKLFPIYSMRK